ncbi:MAG: hypothetical protein QOG03_21 [Actinomycetota bacterium]|nr:hypothetical protein [Actinomycetota bacterium]
MSDRFFPYAFDWRYAPVWLALGAFPGRDGVTLTADGELRARLGWFRLRTPLANVDGAHVTGPYRWWTPVGARLSGSDDGLTFGTNARQGTCIHFTERVGPVLGARAHSALTVTVADPEGLVAALLGAVGEST